MENMTPKQIKDMMVTGRWIVRFIKINGQFREMNCTRDIDTVHKKLPYFELPKGVRVLPEKQIAVFDLDKSDWRSFKSDRVLSIDKISEDITDVQTIDKQSITTIKSLLSKGTWVIRFKLLSGEIYELVGTRDWNSVLDNNLSSETNKKSRAVPENQIIIYDLINDTFKSFIYENLISIKKISDQIIKDTNPKIMINKNLLINKLHKGLWDIKFVKRDGSNRNMIGTLDPNIYKKDSEYTEPEVNNYLHLIQLWDIENHGWRNIRFNSIYLFKPYINRNFNKED